MRRDLIVIVEYDEAWPNSFRDAQATIAPVLAPYTVRDIEHMGSTAVPGLAAKPIIDMLAVVSDVDATRRAITDLREVGWIHAPEPFDDVDRMLSFCAPSIERRSHHLHVVEESCSAWRGWLAFRDFLRVHPNTALEYAAVKERLAVEHGHDPNGRDAYRSGKDAFVVAVTRTALAAQPDADQ